MSGQHRFPSPPLPSVLPLCHKSAATQIQISTSSSERGQKSEQTRDTPTSAHAMGAGAGSVCWHRVTALPDLLSQFWAALLAWLTPAPFPATQHCPACWGTEKNQCQHNTHVGGVSCSAPGAQLGRDRESVTWDSGASSEQCG